MTIDALLGRLSQAGIRLRARGGKLVASVPPSAMDDGLRAALQRHKPELLERIGHDESEWWTPALQLTPDMLPLVTLTQAELDDVVAQVPGGAANVQDIYPLAPLQEGILFHHLVTERGDPYVLANVASFETRAQLDAYLGALQSVIDRHDILRTAFVWEGVPEPVQVVWRRASLVIDEVELDPAAGDAVEQLYARFDPRHTRLDIRRAPLIRIAIAHDPRHAGGAGRWLLQRRLHHLIEDHTTLEILQHEIRAHLDGEADRLPVPLPFRNFVAQVRRGMTPAEHTAYFRDVLGDVTEPTAPFGLLDAWGDGRGIGEAVRRLPATLSERLRSTARRLGVSVAGLSHVAFGQVLARVSGRDDVVFGTVLLGRLQGGEGADRVLGPFMNTLPVRVRADALGAEASVREMQRQLAELMQHEHASLALAQRCSGVRAPTPLFSAVLNYRYNGEPTSSGSPSPNAIAGMKGLRMETRTNYPLLMAVDDFGDGFALAAYVAEPFEADRVCALMETALVELVRALDTGLATPLALLEVLPAAERALVVETWNATDAPYPAEVCLHALVAAQAARTPTAVAVTGEGVSLTYAELAARAAQLAHVLRTGHGVGPEVRVALCLEAGVEAIAALLGVLTAGGAYVPLDPLLPEARLAYLLRDSGAVVALTTAATLAAGSGLAAACAAAGVPLAVLPAPGAAGAAREEADARSVAASSAAVGPAGLAYVIYTSGSTGAPKGVMVPHRGVVNAVTAFRAVYAIDATARVLLFAPLHFDASVLDIFPALTSGATLVVAPRARLVPGPALVGLLEGAAVTHAKFTPSALLALPAAALPALRVMVTGGEACPAAVVQRWAPGRRFFNGYGPTEASVRVTAGEPPAAGAAAPPIGHLVANARGYVLDAWGAPVPVGVAGELYLGGVPVARGYLNRPGLTAARFVPDPFGGSGGRLYRTGDRVRWGADGQLEFLGRTDFQVKVRGQRIELGEIEAVLAAHPAVEQGVVLAREDVPGDVRLVAYLVGDTAGAPDAEALRAYLAERLPGYMVPAAYVWLAALPVTASGKVDRRALPAPAGDAYATAQYEAPVGAVEEALAAIWAELLGVERVGRQDDFFALGGHSLLAVQVISRVRQVLDIEVALTALFRTPTLAGFARAARESTQAVLPPIAPLGRDASGVPVHAPALSFAQERLWFLEQLGGLGAAYHIPWGLRLRGALDAAALRGALDALVARHEVLRTTFRAVDGVPRQVIAPVAASRFALDEDDMRLSDEAEATRALHERATAEAVRPFDLAYGPLIRGRLIRLSENEHALLVTMHHIVSDAWSTGVLLHELGALYAARVRGESDPLPPLPLQYADYAVWQRAWVTGEVLREQSDYWRAALAGAPELLQLPTDRPRPAVTDYTGATVPVVLDAELTAGLKALAQRHGVTLFHTLLAGWAVVLGRLAGQRDVVIGTPTANRAQTELEGLIGFFVNTLAVRVDLEDDPTAAELLARVKTRALDAQAHEALPFERVVEIVNPTRSSAHNPIVQVLFSWQNVPARPWRLTGLTPAPLRAGVAPRAKLDMTLAVGERGDRIVGSLEYATALWERETVARYMSYLPPLLAALVANDGQRVSELPLLPEAERALAVETWNDTGTARPPEATVHELFEAQAARTPAAVAVTQDGASLTYAELDAQATQLARYLRAEHGVGPEVRVALCLERTPELVVALLGVLKAGGCYVPLDPAYPAERLRYLLEDSGAVVVLAPDLPMPGSGLAVAMETLPRTVPVLPLWAVMPSDEPPAPLTRRETGLTSQHAAYVIYTSGSTGRPKGVVVPHAGVESYLTWAWAAYAAPTALVSSSVAFDATVTSLLAPLTGGATVQLVREGEEIEGLFALLREDGAVASTDGAAGPVRPLVKLTPAHLDVLGRMAMREETRMRAATFVIGGEALPTSTVSLWRALQPAARLVNEYGPTEAVVGCVTHEVDPEAPLAASVPIGRPAPGVRAYVLDEQGVPVPLGVVGELCVGGTQVTRGYLDRPGQTAARFVPDPFGGAGQRLYRTGDRVRWLANGELAYLGRTDFQVKIRGYRIELGEIEAALAAHPEVEQAVVLAREDMPGERRLVAYVVTAPGTEPAGAEALGAYLAERLPAYMVPAAYVQLATLPLTSSGKVDRAALPTPESDAYASAGYEAPLGTIEEALAQLWGEILGVERVGRHDDFFALGGHSLLAVTLVERMGRQGLTTDVGALFTTPTLAALAAATTLTGDAEVPAAAIPADAERLTPEMLPLVALTQAELDGVVAQVDGGAANVQDIYPLTPLQEGILFHHLLAVRGDPYLQVDRLTFETREQLDAYVAALQAVIDRHDIMRTAFIWEGVPEPVQVVWRRAPLPIEEVKLDPSAGDVAKQLHARFDPRLGRLDIRRAPLFQLAVAHDPRHAGGAGRWILLRWRHHLIEDHRTLVLLGEELVAHLNGEAARLPTPVPFRNFVARARQGVSASEHEAYFRRLLGDVTEPTAPFGLVDAWGDGRGMSEARRRVDGAPAETLRVAARRLGVSVAGLCHVAFAQVLARLSGRDDVVFATVLFGRMQGGAGADRALGLFMNTLPVRVRVGDVDVETSVRDMQRQLAELLRHEHASLALAQRCSGLQARTPLLSALLNYRHAESSATTPTAADRRIGRNGARDFVGEERTNYPLSMSINDWGESIGITVQLAQPFEPAVVCELMQTALVHLGAALEHVPTLALGALDVLPAAERARVLMEWNATAAAWPVADEPRVMALIAAQAARTPDAMAVRGDDGTAWSYAVLLGRAARVADALRAGGVGPETVVAVLGPREPQWLAAMLGIWLAGGAYLPLDGRQPAPRLAAMLRQAGSRHVLVAPGATGVLAEVEEHLEGAGTALWRGAWAGVGSVAPVDPVATVAAIRGAYGLDVLGGQPAVAGRQLAYVLFTSGSTGLPKGALLEAAGLVNHLWAKVETLGLTAADAVAQTAAVSFDISVWQLVVPLLVGARVEVVGEEAVYEPAQLAAAVVARGVTVLELVPSQLPPLLPFLPLRPTQGGDGADSALRWLLATGEALPVGLARQWLALQPGCGLVNAYGPTECSDDVTQHELPPRGDARAEAEEGPDVPEPDSIPIGRPLLNTRLYVLDGRGEPVPVGVVGELYAGGQGVGRGYAGSPGQTAERFVPDPFGPPGSRLYRTGDRVRWLPDGTLTYLGRTDFQVKVRGQRVELGEIEAVLAGHPGVEQAVVLAREDVPGDVRLVAYLVVSATADPSAAAASPEGLRAWAGERLPAHMVPAAYVTMAALPLMASGKVDRRALPAPESDAYASEAYAAPVGDVEVALAAIWAELLKVERVGRNDDFFALGGHSLLAVALIERMRRQGLRTDVRTLFMTPTLAAIAAATATAAGEVLVPAPAIPPGAERLTPEMLPLVVLTQAELDGVVAQVAGGAANVQDIYPLAPLQEGILFHHLLSEEGDPYLLASLLSFETRAQLDAYVAALRAVIARHDILRTAVVWEGVPEPVQVVWRDAPFQVEEVSVDPAAGDTAQQLFARFHPRHTRLDIRRAPLLRIAVAHDPDHGGGAGRWLLLRQLHHLIEDHTTLEILQQEILAHLHGEADRLPSPVPFRTFVAQARLGMAAAEHEAYFDELLGDVTETTAPFGLVDAWGDGRGIGEARQRMDAGLVDRLRATARRLGVSVAGLCHVAFAQVLARVSGQDDVVFGTVLFGRLQGGAGADRALGLFMNTLPVRVRVDELGAEASVREMQRQLAELVRHEHATLSLAQRCSGVRAPAPLFSALLNYRHGRGRGTPETSAHRGFAGMTWLRVETRTNYPLMVAIDDRDDGLMLSAHVASPIEPDRVCALMTMALTGLVEALEQP